MGWSRALFTARRSINPTMFKPGKVLHWRGPYMVTLVCTRFDLLRLPVRPFVASHWQLVLKLALVGCVVWGFPDLLGGEEIGAPGWLGFFTTGAWASLEVVNFCELEERRFIPLERTDPRCYNDSYLNTQIILRELDIEMEIDRGGRGGCFWRVEGRREGKEVGTSYVNANMPFN